MASDSVHLGPTNYEDSTPEWASDAFAYRSPNKNPFLRFAYPRVKKGIIENILNWLGYVDMLPMKVANAITELFKTLFSKQVLLYRISLHAQKYKKV